MKSSVTSFVRLNQPPTRLTGYRTVMTSDSPVTAADTGGLLAVYNDGTDNMVIRLPAHTTDPLPLQSTFLILAYGTGPVRILGEAGAGLTVWSANGGYLRTQYSIATAVKLTTLTWLLFGDLST